MADGGVESAQVEMLFAVKPHEIALRDAAAMREIDAAMGAGR